MENWVLVRAECSAAKVFEQLRLEVNEDVQTRQALRVDRSGLGFDEAFVFSTNRTGFSVAHIVGKSVHRSATFSVSETAIVVSDEKGTEYLRAGVTINKDRQCRLRLGDEELESWQFRQKALERLFFE